MTTRRFRHDLPKPKPPSVSRLLLDAALKDPEKLAAAAVSLGGIYVTYQHNARIEWLQSLTTHGSESVRSSAQALLKALDAAGVKRIEYVAPATAQMLQGALQPNVPVKK